MASIVLYDVVMVERPRFKSHYRIEVRNSNLVVAVSESRALALEGRLYPLITPWIDGLRTISEIAAASGAEVTELDAAFGIGLLEEQGLIEESGVPIDPWHGAFRELTGPRSPLPLAKRAAVVAPQGIPAQPLEAALQSLGVELGQPADLTILLTTDYLLPAIEIPEPWMPVKAAGAVMWFGPAFDGGEGACWECLTARLREWRRAETFVLVRRECDDLRPSAPMPPAVLEMALRLAAIEALRYLSGALKCGPDRTLFTFDMARMRLESHLVAKLEHCPRCSRTSSVHRVAIDGLAKRKPAAAEAVLRRFGRHISPVTGIVGRLEPYGVEAPGLATSCSAPYLFPLATRRQVLTQRIASGKGASRTEAEVSALCEALERYSGIFRGNEIRRRATHAELGDEAIDPASLLHFSAAQYRNREAANLDARPEQWIPAPFERDRAIDWTPVWSLLDRRWRWAPTAYCYYGYPSPEDHRFCAADSNGCAAGATGEEAALHGLLELVERDAVALWWYNRISREAVAPEEVSQQADLFAGHYAALGRRLRLFDITSDLGVPVFAAISWRPELDRELILGFGSGFEAAEAAQRALTEMHQFLELSPNVQPRLHLDGNPRDHDFLIAPDDGDLAPASPCGDPETLLARLQNAGMDVLLLDQSRKDVGMPVVRTIVPGLRHFWPRFAPGRLYTVPVAMGWRAGPVAEAELNRTPFFC